MGVEYALVHDATREAYDLGKYCGSPWRERMPSTRDDVRDYFVSYYVDDEDPMTEPEMVEPVTDAVWAFIEAHPGCRLVSEHDDLWWGEGGPRPDTIACWGEEKCFRQLGSRYDVKASQRQGDPK